MIKVVAIRILYVISFALLSETFYGWHTTCIIFFLSFSRENWKQWNILPPLASNIQESICNTGQVRSIWSTYWNNSCVPNILWDNRQGCSSWKGPDRRCNKDIFWLKTLKINEIVRTLHIWYFKNSPWKLPFVLKGILWKKWSVTIPTLKTTRTVHTPCLPYKYYNKYRSCYRKEQWKFLET